MKWLKIGAIVLFVALALLVAWKLAAEWYIRNRILGQMPPELAEGYDDWLWEKLSFEPEDLEAPPFFPGTVEAAETFKKEWDLNSGAARTLVQDFKKMRNEGDGGFDDPARQDLFDRLGDYEDLIVAFLDLVDRPDYEIDAIRPSYGPADQTGIPMPNYLAFQDSVKLLHLKTFALASQGKDAEALATSETIVRASKAHRFSPLITRLIQTAGVLIGVDAWNQAVVQCDDPDLLRQSLERLNKLMPDEAYIDREFLITVGDSLGMLRAVRREGIEVRIQDRTARELVGESYRATALHLEEVALPAAQGTPFLTLSIQEAIETYRKTAAKFQKGTEGIVPSIGLAQIYSMYMPNALEAYSRNDVSRCKMDLLRLEIARKLYHLERGEEIASIEDLVPDYLSEVPNDLFSEPEQPYGFAERVYSVGPDKIDGTMALAYDATNGTISGGDIFLPVWRGEN